MTLLIKNGRVINPGDKTVRRADIYVKDGVIAEIIDLPSGEADDSCAAGGADGVIGMKDGAADAADGVIDAAGAYCMPGFIDMHVHLRDPGLTYKEDIATGGAAALHGGFTTIVAMPNTKPVADCPEVITYVQRRAAEVTKVHVLQVGSVTKGMAGEELSDIRGMAKAGCICLSEDGKSVMNSDLYRDAMRMAAEEDMTVLAHCEDINLVHGGVLNADGKAAQLGMPGITNAVEDIIAARDILLAKETGVRLHLCHCSTRDSVEMVRLAKADGVHVTAEVCPHHFSLSSDAIDGDDANFKMNPPLRTREDMETLRRGLSEDIMDVIATDHAPHAAEEKAQSIRKAPFGIVGLETAAALTYTNLVKPGLLTMMQMAEKMSYRPAQILGLNKGVIEVGAPADLTIFDADRAWTVDPDQFRSKGRNTPFAGMTLFGKVTATIVDGEVAFSELPITP